VRLVYLGTPAAAVPPLEALLEAGHEIPLVVSQPDRKRGRGAALVPSPVKAAALDLGLPVTHRVDDVLDVGAELGVVVAFGRLIKPHVLDVLPMVNLHFSLLPRWRGAAPVERAVLAGDTETGVCVMGLEEGLDTGPVFARQVVPIGADEGAADLRDRLVDVGARLLVETLSGPLPEPEPQEGEPTYAAKIEPAELEIDWTRSAAEIHRLVRMGGAWTTFRGRRLKVHRSRLRTPAAEPATDQPAAPGTPLPGGGDGVGVVTGQGVLELLAVQPEGKAVQDAAAWRNGARPGPDDRLGG
jgi:methionyl-tRNA formyltransferase